MIKKIFVIITLLSILESCGTKKETDLTKPPFLFKPIVKGSYSD